MTLTAAQHAARDGKITASFLPHLMAGEHDIIHDKWLELIGDPSWRAPDHSMNWPVLVGNLLEGHALDWHERKSHHELTRRGEVVQHPELAHVCATLDAYRAHDDCVVECKATGQWMKLDHVIAYYTPQVIVQKACTGARNGALLICHGTAEPAEYEITIDPDYEAQLWLRLAQFWDCVCNLTPPVHVPAITPPEEWREIDLDNDGPDSRANWAAPMREHLATWLNHHHHAAVFEEARAAIKELLPEDCRKLTYKHITITRARNRAVTLRRGARP